MKITFYEVRKSYTVTTSLPLCILIFLEDLPWFSAGMLSSMSQVDSPPISSKKVEGKPHQYHPMIPWKGHIMSSLPWAPNPIIIPFKLWFTHITYVVLQTKWLCVCTTSWFIVLKHFRTVIILFVAIDPSISLAVNVSLIYAGSLVNAITCNSLGMGCHRPQQSCNRRK